MARKASRITRIRFVASLGLLILAMMPLACGGGGGGGYDFSNLTITWAVAVSDLNGDGLADIAATSAFGYDWDGFVSIFLQDPAHPGSFLPVRRHAVSSDPIFVGIGDLNGDGLPDLVTANARASNISILFQRTGSPGDFLSAQAIGTGSHPNGVAIGRVNGDALPDLAVADLGLSLFLQDAGAPATFLARISLGLGSTASVAIGDLNGDGLGDLAVVGGGKVQVLLQDPAAPGTYRPPVELAAGLQPGFVAIADLNADGRFDLVVTNSASNTVSVLLQDATAPGTFLPATNLPVAGGPYMVAVGDLDGDGKPDLAVADDQGRAISVLLQDASRPGQFLPATNYQVESGTFSVAIGDLNEDGRADLAAAISNGVAIFLQDPSRPGTFLPTKILEIIH